MQQEIRRCTKSRQTAFHMSSMYGLPEAFPPASMALRVIGARKPPLHDKAVFLQEYSTVQKVYTRTKDRV
jgi:hypothetical protein